MQNISSENFLHLQQEIVKKTKITFRKFFRFFAVLRKSLPILVYNAVGVEDVRDAATLLLKLVRFGQNQNVASPRTSDLLRLYANPHLTWIYTSAIIVVRIRLSCLHKIFPSDCCNKATKAT